jgi:uncharacterized SAM-binding protein YcdF (DUF218 family)
VSFVLSKLVWALLSPLSLLFLALLLALLLQRRRPALSRGLLALGLLFIAALGLTPLAHWAVLPLQQRFPIPAQLPARVDGIVVLGGAISPQNDQPGQTALNPPAERVTNFVILAQRYPDARLVYSGGSGEVRDQSMREADAAKPLLEALGIAPQRMIYERDSRNTWENALYSKKLADPKPGETWLLITSAWHMPRAVGCFRRAGWSGIVPYPVDFQDTQPEWGGFDADGHLYALGMAEKEWIGLLAYHLMGRTDALFPAPLATH